MSSNSPSWAIPALFPVALLATALAFYYLRYSSLPRERALFLWAVSLIVTGCWFAIFIVRGGDARLRSSDEMTRVFAAILCVLTAIPFVIRLWRKWVEGNLTEEERTFGSVGWRAWFGGGNIIPALLIAVLAWKGFDLSLPLMLFTTLGALAVYPAIVPPTSATGTPLPTADSMASDREKVLSLLESGKITAMESAELLNALGSTARASEPAPIVMTSAQRLVLIGAGVLLIGFFLPWLVIDPNEELNRVMGQLNTQVQGMMPGNAHHDSVPVTQMIPFPSKQEIQVAGGSLGKGLGWAALGLGMVAALLPYTSRNIDFETQRLVRFLALGAGATIILHVFTSAPRSIGIGLIVAALGYALEFVGVARERRIS